MRNLPQFESVGSETTAWMKRRKFSQNKNHLRQFFAFSFILILVKAIKLVWESYS